jgi:hypothetical protein
MPNAIDGLSASMANIWVPEIKVKSPNEKRDLADSGVDIYGSVHHNTIFTKWPTKCDCVE